MLKEPKRVFGVKFENGVFCVSSCEGYQVEYLGGTIPTVMPLGGSSTYLYFTPKKDQDGIIALNTPTKHGHCCCFLEAAWGDGKCVLGTELPWIPRPDSPGQLFDYGVGVTIEGITYCSDKKIIEKNPSWRYVPDGNLLCEHLYYNDKPDEVKQAAQEYEEEMSASERLLEVEDELKSERNAKTFWKEQAEAIYRIATSNWWGRAKRLEKLRKALPEFGIRKSAFDTIQ